MKDNAKLRRIGKFVAVDWFDPVANKIVAYGIAQIINRKRHYMKPGYTTAAEHGSVMRELDRQQRRAAK